MSVVDSLRRTVPGRRSAWYAAGALALAAAIAVTPIALRGASCGHDFDFHLVSWMEARNAWQHGLFYPHWAASPAYGAGEPRFVFYPPLTWMLGALLGCLFSWPLVPLVLSFLLLFATGLAVRALARESFSELPATLAGVLALSSGYALFTACERTAYGELAGGLWIPLLLLFALRPTTRVWKGVVPISLTLSACWLSNAPLGVMATYLLAFVAAVQSLSERSLKPALRAASAAAPGLLLCGFYLLPAAWEQRWVEIEQATSDPGERIENSFLFGHHADPSLLFHDQVLRQASWIGTGMLAVSLLAAFVLLLRRRQKAAAYAGDQYQTESQRTWYLILMLIPAVVLLLQLPISLPIWNHLPKLRFLQFPWRWLLVLEAPLALLVIAALQPLRKASRRVLTVLCFACCVASAVYANHAFYQPCEEQDRPSAVAEVWQHGAGFEGTSEYTPLGADSSLTATGLPAACLADSATLPLGEPRPSNDGDATAPLWSPQQHSCMPVAAPWSGSPEHLRLVTQLPKSGWLILRLNRYPAWRVSLNGQEQKNLPQRADGLIVVPAQAGQADLAVDWQTTPDVWLGRGLSLLGGMILLILVRFNRRSQNA